LKIHYLRQVCAEDSANRIIIFSQWQRMLYKIGSTLEENGIQVVFCKGNVMQRNKAIRNFYSQDNIRVIMLSLENAASGTNLTQGQLVLFVFCALTLHCVCAASHIVLIDPIAGTREEAQAGQFLSWTLR
jgi:hypothetical protein